MNGAVHVIPLYDLRAWARETFGYGYDLLEGTITDRRYENNCEIYVRIANLQLGSSNPGPPRYKVIC
jgi:hypothetical protein